MRAAFLSALVVHFVACSHANDGAESKTASAMGTVRITSVDVDLRGTDVLVRVQVENETEKPVFAITSPRRIHYRADRHLLELDLAESPILPMGTSAACHYVLPSQRPVGPRRREMIEVRLPRIQKHLITWNPMAEIDEPLYQAKEVHVALGWSDVPLEPDRAVASQCALEMSENVAAKQRGIATGTWTGS